MNRIQLFFALWFNVSVFNSCVIAAFEVLVFPSKNTWKTASTMGGIIVMVKPAGRSDLHCEQRGKAPVPASVSDTCDFDVTRTHTTAIQLSSVVVETSWKLCHRGQRRVMLPLPMKKLPAPNLVKLQNEVTESIDNSHTAMSAKMRTGMIQYFPWYYEWPCIVIFFNFETI